MATCTTCKSSAHEEIGLHCLMKAFAMQTFQGLQQPPPIPAKYCTCSIVFTNCLVIGLAFHALLAALTLRFCSYVGVCHFVRGLGRERERRFALGEPENCVDLNCFVLNELMHYR